MHRLAIVYEDILYRFNVQKVANLGIDLFSDFPYNSIPTCFSKFDPATEGSIKHLLLDIVNAIPDKNRISMPKDTDSYHAYAFGVAHRGDKERSWPAFGKLYGSRKGNKNALRAVPQGDLVFTMFR